ncbi:toll/interleukin-1 receptor domain-containing protein [Paenibacillus polymyxa]|uniref:toll/interleukin-1 receptor domain-containing protein n=1 Tax=Paenibacillus polymyxa TaxID=1406 RepID=UPI002ED053D5|nr:toll/interleukin-1 receptor domain-containing protein [Paenibacillus polymyxa]
MKISNVAPSVFISYSWSSDEHEKWVIDLATRLRKDGVDAFIDKWRLKPGHDRFAFMERMIMDEDIHKVLVICDKEYKAKADQRSGGVGIETQIISKNVYTHINQEKFIPVVAERGESGKEFIPSYLESHIYIDLSSDGCFESGYKKLLCSIFETQEYMEPEIGKIPDYILEKKNTTENSLQKPGESYSQSMREIECFENKFIFNDTNYKHSIKKVNLEAFLPNKYDLGSCLFSFVDKDISGCMFTLSDKNLITTLFDGMGTYAKECKRDFLVGYDIKDEEYIVQFPHNRFKLNVEATEELCNIVDKFYPVYLNAYRKYHPTKLQKITNARELCDILEKISLFYAIHNSVTLSVEVKKAYAALKLVLFRSKLVDGAFYYIASKLPIEGLTKNNIFIKIQERQDSLTKEFYHNGEVDMILRSLVVVLRDCESLLSQDEVKEITKLLQVFEDVKDLFDSYEDEKY